MKKQHDKVGILLSTYNAQKYLKEQLDSLLAQHYSAFELWIRDDGSSDDTISILKEYEKKDNRVHYYAGKNLGAIGSFFDLMQHVRDRDYAYIAFCDQDDFWKKEKLEIAVKAIAKEVEHQKHFIEGNMNRTDSAGKIPVLYCSKTQLVDEQLNPLQEEIKRKIHPGFGNALLENIVTGCTTVINRDLNELICQYMPKYCIMHDWWIYLIATLYGKVIYDETPHILYRQHGKNVMGIERSYGSEMKSRLKKFKGRKSNICMQAEELVRLMKENPLSYENYPLLNAHKIQQRFELAEKLSVYKKGSNRFSFVFSRKTYRQRKGDDLIFRILFLLGMR